MIRVARIITRLNIGGPAIQAVMLSDRLRAHGFDTLLVYGRLSPGEGDMSYLLDGRDLRSAFVPTLQRSISPALDGRALFAVHKLLADFKPEIVHTHTAKAGTIGRLAAIRYARARGTIVPKVHTYHGHVLEGYFRFAAAFVAIERALARATDRLIGVSPHVAAELARDYRIGRPDQWQVVPLGFDLSPFLTITDEQRANARRDLQAGARTVTIVGRLTAIKQHDLFLRAAAEIRRTGRSVIFQVVGDGERRAELQALADSLGIADAVRFLGWRRDLATIYAATDVCVLTSRNEGTPVALIEALAAGIPVVSTDVGGVKDVVTDATLGRLAPDGDVEMLARLVMESFADDAARPDRVEARRASVVARYGIDRLTSDVATLYKSLVDARARISR